MATKISRKSLKHDEFVETAFDAGAWLEAHWQYVAGVVAGLVVIAVVVFGAVWWNAGRRTEARRMVAETIGSYSPASGDPEGAGGALERLEHAAAKAGGSPTGRVADFYRGVIRLRTGDPEVAVPLLEGVISEPSSRVLQDAAKATLAAALAEAGERERAKQLWRELSEDPEAMFSTEMALLELAKLHRLDGQTEEARRTLQQVVDRYPQTSTAGEARALLESVSGERLPASNALSAADTSATGTAPYAP